MFLFLCQKSLLLGRGIDIFYILCDKGILDFFILHLQFTFFPSSFSLYYFAGLVKLLFILFFSFFKN